MTAHTLSPSVRPVLPPWVGPRSILSLTVVLPFVIGHIREMMLLPVSLRAPTMWSLLRTPLDTLVNLLLWSIRFDLTHPPTKLDLVRQWPSREDIWSTADLVVQIVCSCLLPLRPSESSWSENRVVVNASRKIVVGRTMLSWVNPPSVTVCPSSPWYPCPTLPQETWA